MSKGESQRLAIAKSSCLPSSWSHSWADREEDTTSPNCLVTKKGAIFVPPSSSAGASKPVKPGRKSVAKATFPSHWSGGTHRALTSPLPPLFSPHPPTHVRATVTSAVLASLPRSWAVLVLPQCHLTARSLLPCPCYPSPQFEHCTNLTPCLTRGSLGGELL